MSQPLSDFRPQSDARIPQPAAGESAPGSENPYQSPEIPETPEIAVEQAPAFSPLEAQIAVLMHQGKTGANWFYRIAAFSIINTLIMLISGGIYFVLGLGVTFIADAIAQNAGQNPQESAVLKVVAFVFSVVMSLVFCGFGWLANKRFQPLYFLGMTLYLLDGLLFLMLGQMLACAFHAYALYCMWGGFRAYRQLAALEKQLMDPLHPAGVFNLHQPIPTDVA